MLRRLVGGCCGVRPAAFIRLPAAGAVSRWIYCPHLPTARIPLRLRFHSCSPKPPRPGGSSSGAAASALCFRRKAESRGQLLGVGSEPSEGLAKAPPARRPNPNRRLLGLALLATAPVAAAQGVAAWLSLVLRTGGERPEQQPHSVLGYFFAAFWYGDQRQCGGSEG